jgi:hypothetical protein
MQQEYVSSIIRQEKMTRTPPQIPTLEDIIPQEKQEILERWGYLLRRISPTRMTVIMSFDNLFEACVDAIKEIVFCNYDSCASEEIVQKKISLLVLIDKHQNISDSNPADVFVFYADGTSLHIGEAFDFNYGKTRSELDEIDAEDSEFITPPHYFIHKHAHIPYICAVNRIRERLCGNIPTPPTSLDEL